MSKSSNTTRGNWPVHALHFTKIGSGNPEISDRIENYTLPDSVATRLDSIKKIDTYNKLKAYLAKSGIKLTSDIDSLNNGENSDAVIESVSAISQKIVTGIETYKSVFGRNALRNLKEVKLYDNDESARAAYYFNKQGENDPKAGSIRFRDWTASGRVIFHELAHALQDSMKKNTEDALSFSDRITAKAGKSSSGYAGRGGSTENAENMADGLGFAFTVKPNTNYINRVRKAIKG